MEPCPGQSRLSLERMVTREDWVPDTGNGRFDGG